MPYYIYQNKLTSEVREIFQSMKDTHEYFGENGDEKDWIRIFTKPNTAIQSRLDPHSKESFMKYTESKKGTVGDLLDASKEASEARSQSNGGIDPVKEAMYDKYAAENNGMMHLSKKQDETKKQLSDLGISID